VTVEFDDDNNCYTGSRRVEHHAIRKIFFYYLQDKQHGYNRKNVDKVDNKFNICTVLHVICRKMFL
jgi:hypothetical protein